MMHNHQKQKNTEGLLVVGLLFKIGEFCQYLIKIFTGPSFLCTYILETEYQYLFIFSKHTRVILETKYQYHATS